MMAGTEKTAVSSARSARRRPVRAHAARLAAAALAAAALATAALVAAGGPPPASAAPLSPAQAHWLVLAQRGVATAERHWADRKRGWFDARLYDHERYPLATIWDVVPLFESVDALAIAQPSVHNRAEAAHFANSAEAYLNRGLRPLPGYSPYPGDREAGTLTWFDDNGWWGIAFVNAYRATGSRRYLRDAERALYYIAAVGWDPAAGGIWWNTGHPYKAGEALASGTLLATLLYQSTHSSFALAQAKRFSAWADGSGFSPADNLYAGSSIDPTPIDYIEGPLIYAEALLCRLTEEPSRCERAETLKATALLRFGQTLEFSPQYDAIYAQWMLALYALDGDPALYRLAARNAERASALARNSAGLYLLSWGGQTLPVNYARPGMLQTQSATTSLFAWLAAYAPPAG